MEPVVTAASAAIAEVEEAPAPTVTVGGATFTLRSPCPMGALAVFAARLSDKNPLVQASALVRLMRAWVVPEQHDQIDTMMESVETLDEFMLTELPRLVEAGTARPTSAPSS